MSNLSRRRFMAALGALGLALPLASRAGRAQAFTAYDGPLFVSFAADGAWDTASHSDPKGADINAWIGNPEYQDGPSHLGQAGNIPYARFANNQVLFENHHDKMLVLHGVDAQTAAHAVGIRHNWGGRIERGYPVIGALFAAVHGTGLPLPYLTNGGYRETGGEVPFALIENPGALGALTRPFAGGTGPLIDPAQVALAKAARTARRGRLFSSSTVAPRLRRTVTDLITAAAGVENLAGLAAALDAVFPTAASYEDHPQVRVAIACMSAGLTASADLFFPKFDTHGGNDVGQKRLLTKLNSGIDLFWTLAAAQGLTARMRVYVASDFARTPFYNDAEGKDHWPIGSSLFMQAGASWADRVVGQTTADTQQAFGLLPDLSAVLDAGTMLKPRHVHHVLRNWLDIPADHPLATRYPLFKPGDGDFMDLSAMLALPPRGV